MIGPGTGVAPFKAMVEERTAQRKRRLRHQQSLPPPPPPQEQQQEQQQEQPNDSQSPPQQPAPPPPSSQQQEEQQQQQPHNNNDSEAPPPPYEWLFFGCRKEKADFYYRGELEGYTTWEEGEGRGLRLVTAFSRDQDSKVYVTHRIKEHGAALWTLLAEGNASVFVAGSAKRMPTDVMDAIRGLAVVHGGLKEAEAARFVDGLVRARRYCVESWSV